MSANTKSPFKSHRLKKTFTTIGFLLALFFSYSIDSMAQDATPTNPQTETEKERKNRLKNEEKAKKEEAKRAEQQRKEDAKAEERKKKEDAKLKKELGPDNIANAYDRFTDKSVVNFHTRIFDKIWWDGTALLLGAEYNFSGSDISKSKATGRYFLTLSYIFNTNYPMTNNYLIMLVDGERMDFGEMQVARYNAATNEGIVAKGVIVYVYKEVTREVLTRISKAGVIQARLNLFEFAVQPRYMNTVREFLNTVPE